MTIFAPQSADALAGKSDEDLDAILRGHILGRAVTLDELRTATGVKTVAGTSLRIERDGTRGSTES